MDEDGNSFEVPNLPPFGNQPGGDPPTTTPLPLIIVGGTGQNVGGTSTGEMAIGIPADTDPLLSDEGIIGGNIFGLGRVQIVGLNSEWRITNRLTVGYEGQAFLEVQAGARISTTATGLATPGDNVGDYDLVFGAYEGSQGFALIDGFASLAVSTNMSLGHSGQGRLDVTGGSRLITRNEAAIGTLYDLLGSDNTIGTGYILVDGAGSRWNVGIIPTTAPPLPGSTPIPPDTYEGLLTIGRQGRGTVEVRNQGWVRVETDTIIGDEAGAYGKAVVSGADSLLWSLEDMFVGNSAGTATGELHIDDLGTARADGDAATGGTFVGALGLIEFNGGTLITPNVVNDGVIRGDGRVESLLVTNNGGDIRNAAGLANLRERLHFTGVVDNTAGSIIESLGGEMIFDAPVINNGQIFGRDAIFRFMGGLDPAGAGGELFIDNTVVEGPTLTVSSVAVGARGSSSILGDLTLTGTGTVDMEIGSDYSQLFVTGAAALAGDINFTLADDYNPQDGDSFEIIDAGTRSGVFAAATMTPNPALPWSLSYTGSSVFLNFGAGGPPGMGADFNGDGIVDADDLAILTANFGAGANPPPPATQAQGDANGDGVVDGADFLLWQQKLGGPPSVPASNPVAGTVPEPSGLALAALGLATLAGLRKRVR